MEKIQILENIILQIKEVISTEKKALLHEDHIKALEILCKKSKNYIEKDKFDCLLLIIKEQNQRIHELEKITSLSAEKHNPFDTL
jgi:hypothetical protein